MIICESWTSKDLVNNLKRLKKEYLFYLAFFSSYYETQKKHNNYIKEIKDQFYSLNLKEWQIDMCWEYMNDDLPFYQVNYVLNKVEKKKK